MQTLSEIRDLLTAHGLRPRKRLGQNFLHDKNQLARLIDAAAVGPGDLVLEVGPGTGTLTEALLEVGAEVIACEIDPDMSAILRERLGDRITLIEGDCLESSRSLSPRIVEAIGLRGFKLVANLPYNAASPLMTTLLIDHARCNGLFVTIQREVADRLLAKSCSKEYGPLSIIVQALASIKKIATLPPSCFWPEPKVDSAMVAITPDLTSLSPLGAKARKVRISPDEARAFARFITQLFTKRRKQLGTILGRQRADWPAGVTPDLRPEALSVDQLIELWRVAGSSLG